jgi:hypothetical protein
VLAVPFGSSRLGLSFKSDDVAGLVDVTNLSEHPGKREVVQINDSKNSRFFAELVAKGFIPASHSKMIAVAFFVGLLEFYMTLLMTAQISRPGFVSALCHTLEARI